MSHRTIIWVAMLWASAAGLHAQSPTQITTQIATATVRGRVEVIGASGADKRRHGTIPGTVVWLTPITTTAAAGEAAAAAPNSYPGPPASAAQNPRLVQKKKSFEPHILVVPAGAVGGVSQSRSILPQRLFTLRGKAVRSRSVRGGYLADGAIRPARNQLHFLQYSP